jgi:hypothetical protein
VTLIKVTNVIGQRVMTAPHTATEAPKAPEAPNQPGAGSFIGFPAIIVAALAAATVALIRPYLEMTTENTVLVAMFISVATTTSTAIYKASVEKITSCYRGRRWTSILLAGLLAGLFACFVGLGSLSGAEVALGKEPSILAPLSAPPSVPLSDSDHPIVDYHEDVDHDGLGAGKSEQHERGKQLLGWVDNNRDQCPLQPGSPGNAGCPPPYYYEDVDQDMLGAGPPHPQGQQPLDWVDNNRDQCPLQPGPSETAGCLPAVPGEPKDVSPSEAAEFRYEIPPEAPPPSE